MLVDVMMSGLWPISFRQVNDEGALSSDSDNDHEGDEDDEY
jgi:hypothetical protein